MAELAHSQALEPAIRAILELGIAEATEAIIAKATKDFEAELRRRIAKAALNVSNFYEMEHQREGLVIRVKLTGGATVPVAHDNEGNSD